MKYSLYRHHSELSIPNPAQYHTKPSQPPHLPRYHPKMPPGPTCTVRSLDHLVLTVSSIPSTIFFYTIQLGMHHETFTTTSLTSTSQSQPQTRHALTFGSQKINLHQSGAEFEPKAGRVQPGSADLCFLTDEPVQAVCERLKERGVEVLEGGGVVSRTGATGNLRSVYVRDPDGNLVECVRCFFVCCFEFPFLLLEVFWGRGLVWYVLFR